MKYVPSALIGQLSRSEGSTVASHNRFGSYFRNRVVPVNPRSTLQTVQRNIITVSSSAWRALTAAQRNGWTAYGAQVVRTDSLGQPYTLTGLQAFTSAYRVATLLSLATLTADPGAPPPLPTIVIGAITLTA